MIEKEILQKIYDEVKTPYKYGSVLKRDNYYEDSPVVFKHNGFYYLSCVEIDSKCLTGYKTNLFKSNDLIHWEFIGIILKENNGWNIAQTGGYAEYIDNNFGKSNEIIKIKDNYIFGYIGGSKTGYETDPLWMGMATCKDIDDLQSYHKLPNPILTTLDKDCRDGESATLYKPDMFIDEKKTLGYPFVMAYNGKGKSGRESIFLAVSNDGYHFKRFGNKAIIAVEDCLPSVIINGDPQIVKIADYYVMFYFIYDGKNAWNTFAASKDLLNWDKWEGQPLIKSEYSWENIYAHKQWIIKEGSQVYHFYCAVQ